MAFILPKTLMFILHGSLFDLSAYYFTDGNVYDKHIIEPFIQVNRINELFAEYSLIETQADFRKFLGIDVVTNLKVLVNRYDYEFYDRLKYSVDPTSNRVYVALKVVLKTVNKTVPFNAPIEHGWEIDDKGLLFTPLPIRQDKTHYVKSIVYGYEAFQMIYIEARNSQHKAALKEKLLSSIGRAGSLDETFHENFWAALEESHVTFYGMKASFGLFTSNITSVSGISDMISFKSLLQNIMRTNDTGNTLYYEMQPLSLISPNFPLVEINSDIFSRLDEVEKKYEDVRIANIAFSELYISVRNYNLTNEQRDQLDGFADDLYNIRRGIEKTLSNLDISTFGSITQISEAMELYGNTNNTHKYRERVNLLRQQFSNTRVQLLQ